MVKIYNSGQEFLTENSDILAKYPLETVFFVANAKLIAETNSNDFLIKLQYDGKILLVVHNAAYPMVIFGDKGLCAEFARIAAQRRLIFAKVLGALDTCEAFLTEYCKLVNCAYEINHAMDMMRCDKVLTDRVDGVEDATDNDAEYLAKLIVDFTFEALGDKLDVECEKERVRNRITYFAVIRQSGKIVSMASIKRKTDYLACIADVYTVPQYRNSGLSCKTVTYLTKQIIDSGRLAYLFVDKKNQISNHLYQKIGYTYAVPQYEIKVTFK